MKRTRRSSRPHNRSSAAPGGSREFLERAARILVECGFHPNDLVREFEEVCSKLKASEHEWNPSTLSYIHDLPQVLTYWHHEPEYVDDRGRPLPLLLFDEGPSLSKLVARVSPSCDPQEVADTLLRLKAIRRVRDRFVPKDASTLLEGEALRVHAFIMILALLRTVDHNIQRKLDDDTRLLERAVTGVRFPVSQLPELQQEMRRRGKQFATDIDALLLRSEVPSNSTEPFTRVTCGVFFGYDTLGDTPAAAAPSSTLPERSGNSQPAAKGGTRTET